MEESLKARLIGAAVLVAIAVLLIPELLSGRKAVEPATEEGAGQRGTRTFTIELGGETRPAARTPTTTSSPAASATAPTPAAAAAPAVAEPAVATDVAPKAKPRVEPKVEAAAPVAQPPVAAAQPKTAPPSASAAQAVTPPAAPPIPARPVAGKGWLIQVGAFGSVESARSLVNTLTAAGFPAHVSPTTRNGKTLHRVRVGPEADRAEAERMAERLKARGLPATVVRNE
jgi:DedD protein